MSDADVAVDGLPVVFGTCSSHRGRVHVPALAHKPRIPVPPSGCPRCSEDPGTGDFCGFCGWELSEPPKWCLACGQANRPAYVRCSGCGERLRE